MTSVRENVIRQVYPPPGPIRVLFSANMAHGLANGMLLTVLILYFTTSVGIPAAQVGIGLTIAAGLRMFVGVPAGHLLDVIGVRTGTIAFHLVQGTLITGYVFVDGPVAFAVVASLVYMAESGAYSGQAALVAAAMPSEERIKARAYTRAANNIGFSVGALIGGLALTANSPRVYVSLLLVCAVMYAASGLVYVKLPAVRRVERPATASRWEVLRDKPFAVFGLLNVVLVMNVGILLVALPIWISQKTNAPPVVYSGILLLNTVMVVLLQVRASKGAETVEGGGRALRRCGVLLALCCALFALAADRPVWLAVTFLFAGAAVHAISELLYSAGSWALAYELAPEHAHGQYQGFFGMTSNFGTMVTPIVVTTLIIGPGWPGWLALGVVLLVAGLLAPSIARWAATTRAAERAA
ncbi:MFS transporter [Umezawaea endophytica]|uniref:MFS transporter n=1 Tax=Umezawaea endophytica TaxID=1654476 RepID=A0A9X3A0A3_9PSEU|nr:MFS transporter [Umezawaea endophytica]MCS7476758.1 MFS transporter [Umezawaea endophytica]